MTRKNVIFGGCITQMYVTIIQITEFRIEESVIIE